MVTARGTISLTQQIPAPSPVHGELSASRGSLSPPSRNEVTDIIPFDEFGKLDDLDFSANSHFDKEAQVLRAPELDDLDDTDNLVVMRLADPSPSPRRIDPLERDSYRGYSDMDQLARRGQHRKQLTGPTRGRVLIGAMAAGAAAAAAHSATEAPEHSKAQTVLAAQAAETSGGPISTSGGGMQMVTVRPAANVPVHNAELAHGGAFAQKRAQREARLQQPLFVMPTKGIFTSGFGY